MRSVNVRVAAATGAALFITASIAAPTAPPASGGALDAAFTNTIKITSKDGEEYVYFNRDGTFTSTGPGPDMDSIGTWKINGDKICTKTKEAPESCGVIQLNRAVGDKWQHKIGDDTVTVEIVKGR